ncbi:MAG: hypothetical protein Greene041619_701 [Candidatus Peregrinibacteria bacterium Greene0416_19]|nr:MAG: hypothetical protein Greene041619_701 [Candidatus Peregrinibacteria bacterium Greene0416_19]
MDDRRFLHEGETLLCTIRPSAGNLCLSLLQGVFDALIGGIGLSVILFVIAAMNGWNVALWVYGLLLLIAYVIVLILRIRLWRHSSFRVTTERILMTSYPGLFLKRSPTIKWNQYQESHVGRRNAFDLLFASRPLCIRHGTPDAHVEACFPSLRYASDLKHYLDKVDSAVRKKEVATLRPFIAKPRGRRDEVPG